MPNLFSTNIVPIQAMILRIIFYRRSLARKDLRESISGLSSSAAWLRKEEKKLETKYRLEAEKKLQLVVLPNLSVEYDAVY